ncbi:hypothetical protein DEF24_25090 [Marinitenerispora sediminis]|uniref:Adhesin n=1 Tax=Marinitenerispora sediminis TaxID=1931232 RepID=A0A368SYL8_9ACTN|nr:hypothetical protein DEF24_25090 [Marinitenerispora sediminis]
MGSGRTAAAEDEPAADATERSSASEDTQRSGGSDEGSTQRSGDGEEGGAAEANTLAGPASSDEQQDRSEGESEGEREAPRDEERADQGADGDGQPAPGDGQDGEAAPPAPAPSEEPSPPAGEQPSAEPSPAAWSFSEVVGPGCPSDAAASYGRAGHWQEGDGRKSWATRQGGDRQEDCNGDYDAIPVSGDPEAGNGEFAYWTFSPGRTGARCELFVHIPQDESPLWIAEQEARYQVFSGDRPEGDAVGVFGIEQAGVRGGWVQVTGFTTPAETFTVQLTNIGADPLAGQGADRSHVAASVVRTTCS